MSANTAKIMIIVAVAAVLFWWPSSRFEFLNYDDNEYVFENSAMKTGLSVEGVRWSFNCGYAANWHPLGWLSLMADVSLARAAERLGIVARERPKHETWCLDCDENALARIMHVHNILLHAANTFLIFVLALWLCRRHAAGGAVDASAAVVCAFAAIMWCVHPLRSEVVCWVSERKELASVFFMLLALLAHLKSGVEVAAHCAKGKVLRLVSISFFALALLSKPVAVTLPLVILAYDWMIARMGFARALLRVLPFAALSFVACLLTLSAQREAMPGLGDMSTAARVSCVLKAPLVYLAQTVFPYGVSSWYAVPRRPEWVWALAGFLFLAALAAILVWWFRVRSRRSAWAAFAVVWLYGGLLPMLGIVKVGGQPHSDRYTYWIGCGLAALLAIVGTRMVSRLSRVNFTAGCPPGVSRRTLACVLAAVLLPYAVCGFARMFVWHDSLSLFRDGYENSREPDQAFTYASNLMPAKRYAEAEAVMREAASAHRDAKTFGRLALVLAQKEHSPSLDEARQLAESSLAGDPRTGEAHAALGHICLREGRSVEAVRHYELAKENGFKDQLIESLLARHRQGKAIGLEARK